MGNFFKGCQQTFFVLFSSVLAIIQMVWLELKHLFWTTGKHAKDGGTGREKDLKSLMLRDLP